MNEIASALSALDALHIVYSKDGFKALPTSHCFATYRVAHRAAQGADGFALYWDVTYEIRLFYRDAKSDADRLIERELEQAYRTLDGLESDYYYIDTDKLDVTVYMFKCEEEF